MSPNISLAGPSVLTTVVFKSSIRSRKIPGILENSGNSKNSKNSKKIQKFYKILEFLEDS